MKFKYNLVKLFGMLPQDMIRAILEFDDTYRGTFQTDIFKEQLLSLYWKQTFVEDTVNRLVFSRLENLVKAKQTYMRPDNAYLIMCGRFQTKCTYSTIRDMRKEIRLIVSPYKNFMRWKMIPFGDKNAYHTKKNIIWDGCIGNSIHDPSLFLSLFYGAGSLGGQMTMNTTPAEFAHIGDTFWF